jgi:transcription termination/antitermination protein NusG
MVLAVAMTETPTETPTEPTAPRRRWYAIHTLSGHEQKVSHYLKNSAEALALGEEIGEVVVPVEEIAEMRDGKRVTTRRKFLPGYVLVEIILTGESRYLVANAPGVTGFVGARGDQEPQPLRPSEVEHILGQIERKSTAPESDSAFRVGDQVKVVDGPFSDFTGVVEDIDSAKDKVSITVSIFGRPTKVELDILQVETAPPAA